MSDTRPTYVSERGADLCVVCRADTGIPTDTPVDQRQHYVEGVGQCCAQCAARIASGEF